METIKTIDLFGKHFNFTIDSKREYNTGIGTILSILLGISYFVACWYFGKDIYYRESPIFLKEDNYELPYPVMTANNSNFNFAFRLETDDDDPIDDVRYFEHLYIYKHYLRNKTTGKLEKDNYEITMEKCKEHHITTIELFENQHLKNYFCANYSNIKYGGDVGSSDEIGLMEFRITRCNADTEKRHGIKCFSNKEIEDKWRYNVHVGTYVTQNLVRPKVYENPVQQTLTYRLDNWDIMQKRKNKLWLSTSHMSTDAGWLFSELQHDHFLEYEKIEFDDYAPPVVEDAVFEFKMYLSLRRSNYERSYISIPTIAAKVGGLLSLVHTVINSLFQFYIRSEFKVFLFQKLLKLEIDEGHNLPESINIRKDYSDKDYSKVNINNSSGIDIELQTNAPSTPIDKKQSFNYNKSTSKIKYLRNWNKDSNKDEEIIINKELGKIISFNKRKRTPITISFCEYISLSLSCCFLNTSRKKSIKDLRYEFQLESNKWLDKHIDIIPFLREIDKLNLLKKIILNESQNFMLNHKDLKVLALLPNEAHNGIESKIEKEDRKKKKKKQLLDYLVDKRHKQKLTDIDIVLFTNLESDMRQSIEEEINFKISS